MQPTRLMIGPPCTLRLSQGAITEKVLCLLSMVGPSPNTEVARLSLLLVCLNCLSKKIQAVHTLCPCRLVGPNGFGALVLLAPSLARPRLALSCYWRILASSTVIVTCRVPPFGRRNNIHLAVTHSRGMPAA